jgi:hypothetical protein
MSAVPNGQKNEAFDFFYRVRRACISVSHLLGWLAASSRHTRKYAEDKSREKTSEEKAWGRNLFKKNERL